MNPANLSTSSCCSADVGPAEAGSGSTSNPVGGLASISPLYWLRFGMSLILTINSMVVAISFNTSELTIGERRMLSLGLLAATLIVFALLGWPLIKNLWLNIRKRQLSMEALFVSGMIGATGYSAVSMVRQTGAIYFEVVSVLLVIYSLGSLFKTHARQRATRTLQQWSPTEMMCHRLRPAGGLVQCRVSEINIGDLVRVFPGQLIPIDGVVASGQAQVKQTNITGEPFPVSRRERDAVQAATHCIDGTLTIRATANGAERTIDGIMESVQAWSKPDSVLHQQSQKLLRHFFRIVMLVCFATLLFWGVIRSDWGAGILNALSVLLVACPCAIGFATPIGIWSGMVRLAGYGLYLDDATTIEKMGAVTHVVLDKTGTLTEFEPELLEFSIFDESEFSRNELLQIITSVEQASEHPIAKVFQDQESEKVTDFIVEVQTFDFLPGRGVSASVECIRGVMQPAAPETLASPVHNQDQNDGVSSLRQLHSIGLAPSPRSIQCVEVQITVSEEMDRTFHCVDLVIDGKRIGVAKFAEKPLAGLGKLQADLSSKGIRISLLSGDSQGRVDRLGFAEAIGNMTADQKRQFVQQHQVRQSILFVGDGVNDAPAMNAAAVSIAISDGSELAMEMADGVWNRARLVDLADAIEVCRSVTQTIRSNILLAATYNVIGMTLAATGLLHPVAAAVLMLASSLTVTVRSTRILDSGDADASDPDTTGHQPPSRP